MNFHLIAKPVNALALLCLAVIATPASAQSIRANLEGFQEVPAVSSQASGKFRAHIDRHTNAITYELSYEGLEGDVTQAHIHFGQKSVNGGISVFLCSNLGNGPVGTQLCPAAPATIYGTIQAADVGAGAGAQGIAAGELTELIEAIREGVAYANVHSTKFPGGEVRGQIR